MLEIDSKNLKELWAHAREQSPNECCGILGLKDNKVIRVYRMENITKSPYRYTMDPLQHHKVLVDLDEKGWNQAIYHSHTHSPAYPSDTDVRLAEPWADTLFVLISLMDESSPVVRAFFIEDSKIIEEDVITEE